MNFLQAYVLQPMMWLIIHNSLKKQMNVQPLDHSNLCNKSSQAQHLLRITTIAIRFKQQNQAGKFPYASSLIQN